MFIRIKPGFHVVFCGSLTVFMGRWGSLALLSLSQSFTIAEGLSGSLRVFPFVFAKGLSGSLPQRLRSSWVCMGR